ncbi:tigger transposable element-derived protein 1-like [Eriocheir sinensis]|uniref:tigger transposable element-derived protein 1-like n=1 Tax=Eriocheir sinensis TaxID=95602 RepID=UPI0021C70E55|nr:tigger transposable element-derived protein 1-like [Eriocheir sinensis]
MKDRLTLLLCANASSDCKIKPLLVYHSENPRPFKKNGVQKSKLSVMWRANKKAWTTRQFFTEWFVEVFAPAVKTYLIEKNLPLKALLLMDNALAHPPGVEEELGKGYKFMEVMFLPPNTTPLIQPMDQNVIASFKKLYTKALFERCFEVTSETELTLREFWKNHFNILHCLRLIDKAWGQVSVRSLQSAWKNLWLTCVTAKDFEGFEPSVQESAVVGDIVSLGRAIGIEVDSDDVEELVQAHSEDLTTDELHQLHQEQLQEVTEELSSGEEEGNSKERVSTAEIKKYLRQWTELGNFLERCHPDIAAVHRNINQFDGNLMQHFRDILKKRQRQITLDRFLLKKESSESASVSEPQPSTSGFTGITPGDELPDGDSSSDE